MVEVTADPFDNDTVESESEEDKAPYNIVYASYCLMVITMISISQKWTASAMSMFFGYGVEPYRHDSHYSI